MTTTDHRLDQITTQPSRLTRRTLLGAVAAATVIGYSGVSGWTTAAEATTGPAADLKYLPTVRGKIVRDVTGFTTDFGRQVTSRPVAVLHPADSRDIAKVLKFCAEYRIPVAMNGQSGEPGELESHSNYGQAQTDGGLQISARSLAGVRRMSKGSAVVGPGTTWAQLVEAALKTGQTVGTLPDYLNLSIGGTVSVGGVGGNVQRAGLCADLVESIEIVTPNGRIQTANRRTHRDLFSAALGGAGQYGIITELTLRLVPAQEMASITSLFYTSTKDYLQDQRALLAVGDLQHHSGELVRVSDDSAWNLKIDLGVYHPAGQPVDLTSVLATLSDDPARRTTVTMPYRDWAFRIAPFVEAISGTGHLDMKKPWVSLLLPGDRAQEFADWAMPQMSQRDLGAGFCLLSPLAPDQINTEMFMMPASSDGTVFFFDLLAFPDPGTEDVDGMFQRNRRFYDKAVSLGAKRYIIGAVPGLGTADWRGHYGAAQYARLSRLKRIVDPQKVLTPGQAIF